MNEAKNFPSDEDRQASGFFLALTAGLPTLFIKQSSK
ncbi:hypothetical protein BGP_6486 [Beggiatoa sp. PS]|nr:hypothetical protein BGP_6486 [Beggiatoa sp. PS]